MAFNAYLIFHKDTKIEGESTSEPEKGMMEKGAIEISDYGFGVSMPVTTSRSDGGGATVGRANFDVFTCNKSIDTATTKLVEFCCVGKSVPKIVLHLYRQGAGADVEESGTIKYAMVVFQHCVITKVGISGGGEELPKESLEFNYGVCEYWYQKTKHDSGEKVGEAKRFGWSTVANKVAETGQKFPDFIPS
jgi:type VI secretion system Hcp family effector